MTSDGTRVFVLGGVVSAGAQADETKLIYVLDTSMWTAPMLENTEHLNYPEPDPDVVNPSEKTIPLVRKSSTSPSTQGQSQRPSYSSSDAHAIHGASPCQSATPEELDHPTSQQISREQNPSRNSLASRPMGTSGIPRHVLEEDDDGEGLTEHHVMLVAPDASSGKEIARLEDGRLIDLERQLSETLVAKAERDRRIAQQADELALNGALLKHAVEEKRRAKLELRELQAKLDESLLSRDQAVEQAQSALQNATSRIAAADERSQPACGHETELAEVRAELDAVRLRLRDAEDGWAKSKAETDTLRAQTAAGPSLVNTDAERVMHRLLDRMQAMEAELSSLRGNEKSIESMECRNEG